LSRSSPLRGPSSTTPSVAHRSGSRPGTPPPPGSRHRRPRGGRGRCSHAGSRSPAPSTVAPRTRFCATVFPTCPTGPVPPGSPLFPQVSPDPKDCHPFLSMLVQMMNCMKMVKSSVKRPKKLG